MASAPKRPRVKTLGEEMFEMYKNNEGTDVKLIFNLEPGQYLETNVHKTILMASSPVLRTMMTERWKNNQSQDAEMMKIELSVNVSKYSVYEFLKYCYLRELPDDLDMGIMLDLLLLADLYAVKSLLSLCAEKFTDKIDQDNCFQIFDSTRLFESVDISNKAFQFLTKHLKNKLELRECKTWSVNLWMKILALDTIPGVEEILLFRNLFTWKDSCIRRDESFRKLLTLIRFKEMSLSQFTKDVLTRNLLSSAQITQTLLHFGNDKPEITSENMPRNCWKPKNSSEFKAVLKEVGPGEIIQLSDATYTGQFVLRTSRVTIRGLSGGKSIIQSAERKGIIVDSSASDCVIEKITLKNGSKGIFFRTTLNRHTIKDLECTGEPQDMQPCVIFHGPPQNLSHLNVNIDIDCR